MRVAQLVETLGTGGAEKLAVQIASGRARAGDFSALITLAGRGPLAEGLDPTVIVCDLGMDPQSLPSQVRALAGLYGLCRDLHLDALQTHLPRANFFGLAIALSTGISVFPTVHNNREFDYGRGVGTMRRHLRRWAYRRLMVHGHRMIAVSDSVKTAMVRELGLDSRRSGRIVVVPNGVVVPEPLDDATKAAVRGWFGLAGDSVLIAGVGRLTEQKNFGDLVRALADLGAGLPRWECVIAGDGPLREELAAIVAACGLETRVHLAGRISKVDRLLGAADIFCLPSLWEGLPLALLEAMAAGLPVIASDIEGVRDVVRDGETGLLAPPGDPAALGAKLEVFLRDPHLRARCGTAARAHIVQRHSLEGVTDRLGRIYAGQKG